MPSVTVTTPEGGVARIVIDRPDKRNAIDPETRDALIDACAMAPLSLESTLEMEAMAQSLAFNGPEFAEGRGAFADKRKPNFR